jgi:hypothetical protein
VAEIPDVEGQITPIETPEKDQLTLLSELIASFANGPNLLSYVPLQVQTSENFRLAANH